MASKARLMAKPDFPKRIFPVSSRAAFFRLEKRQPKNFFLIFAEILEI
jgi:hypothetical protein